MNTGKLARGVSNYFHSHDGHIAVVTALIGLPLLLAVSVALDLGNASKKRANISAGVDAAALAAVIPGDLTDQERADFAKVAFYKNYFGNEKVDLDVTAVRERVDIVAHIQVPTLLSSIAGKDYLDVRERASAIVTSSDVICVLALDPKGVGSISFEDNAKFSASECSVQANSSQKFAMLSTTPTPPSAKSFCVGGTSRGVFSPAVKNVCTSIADPFAHLTPPKSEPCKNIKEFKGTNSVDPTNLPLPPRFDTMASKHVVVMPGRFCRGLSIDAENVKVMSGIYVIEGGPLEIKSYAAVIGTDVTFILKGKDAYLEVKSDAYLQLKAPSTGPYAGVVFYQVPAGKSAPEAKSTIKSGAGINITGTAYFPTHILEISSDTPSKMQAPATSFIAYRIAFTGDSNVEIHVDHEKGGIPPLVPRSDEGARLIK